MSGILSFSLRLLLVILSYAFVGWISYLIFSDLKKMRSGTEEKFVPKIALKTTVDDPPIESIFSKAEIILGRDSTCDFPIDDDRVSMHHCKITHKQNQWWVEDLNSTNGTFLNESFVNTKIILINGDILRLGHVEIIIKI